MNALRVVMNIAAALAVLATTALGLLWGTDRATRWETPRWGADEFVPLRAATGTGARWIFVVNPACSSCMASLRDHEAIGPGGFRRVVLIVDTPVRPGRDDLERIQTPEVWWDRQNVWRERWGHRLYGEQLRFDAGGRLVATIPPGTEPRSGTSERMITSPRGASEGGETR